MAQDGHKSILRFVLLGPWLLLYLPVYITTFFFSKTGAYVQWARAGNGRYVKHLGMSVNFFLTLFLSFGWDGTML